MVHFLRFITLQLIFRTKRVCFTTRIFVLQSNTLPSKILLITRCRSVTNAPPVLSAPTASAVSATLIGEPTPLIKATLMASQVLASSTRSMHGDHRTSHSPDGGSGNPKMSACSLTSSLGGQTNSLRNQDCSPNKKMSMILRALQMSGLQIPMPAPNLAPPLTS
ncbi:hypothetical protein DVH24_042768 [Malus domestica]|uniref:Uncharacterized protein n=1 Tax=Malus domestica TaxID=3750 RepID=A0A498I3F3_MALDO|nr:hypothetical protein DVH24_042768 [Malus domestica]